MLCTDLNMFSILLINLIDNGKNEDIEIIEEKKDNIVEYILNKYNDGRTIFKNINIESVQNFITEQYITETDSRDKGIDNNGLLYLLQIIISYMSNELFNYECN
ncbi:UNVERIFIED_ORG: hypothetical protein B2H95_00740 [Clostridium botulinum]|nr:hypothetical protein [Clostridium botulinum]